MTAPTDHPGFTPEEIDVMARFVEIGDVPRARLVRLALLLTRVRAGEPLEEADDDAD